MAEEALKEPTMEEILASIRKIISEDDSAPPVNPKRPTRPAPVAAADEDEFSLESMLDEPEIDNSLDADSMFEEFDVSDLASAADLDSDLDEAETSEIEVTSFEIDEPEDFDTAETIEFAIDEDTFVEDEPVITPALVFTETHAEKPAPRPQVEAAAHKPVQARIAEDKMHSLTEESTEVAAAGVLARLVSRMDIGSENTIEGLVREMLKPMIKEWLDANLLAIVEDKVEAEVQRIARMAR